MNVFCTQVTCLFFLISTKYSQTFFLLVPSFLLMLWDLVFNTSISWIFHESTAHVCSGPFVQVPLDGILPLCCVNCITHLCVILKLAVAVLNLSVCVINNNIKEHCSQVLPISLHLGIELLTKTPWLGPSDQFLIHQIAHPSNLSFCFRHKTVKHDHVEGITEV